VAACLGGAGLGEIAFLVLSGPLDLTGIPEIVGPAFGCWAGLEFELNGGGEIIDALSQASGG
jgi:hypothetical protein